MSDIYIKDRIKTLQELEKQLDGAVPARSETIYRRQAAIQEFYLGDISELLETVDTQAKEIEKLSNDLYELGKTSFNTLNAYMKQRDDAQMESYNLKLKVDDHKAIADLAVKALTEIADYTNPTGEDGREMIIVAEGALIDIHRLTEGRETP